MHLVARKILNISRGLTHNSLYSIKNLLSDDNVSKTIARLKGMKPIRLQTHEPVKKAAIMLPLCIVNKKVCLLYAHKVISGTFNRERVVFPGGMQATADRNLENTAFREICEDLGIRSNDIHLWGTGSLIVTKEDFSVLPVIGQIKGKLNLSKLKLKNNIQEAFTVTLEELCNSRTNGYTQFKDSYSAPLFMGGRRRIWGLTAMITSIFLKSLLPNHGYTHRVKYIPAVQKSGRISTSYEVL